MSQLKALGPDNAAAITASQRAILGVAQRAALDEAVGLVAQNSEITTPLPLKGGTGTTKAFREPVNKQIKKKTYN